MAEESFDVMISDKEYNELKLNIKKNLELQQKIKMVQHTLAEINMKCGDFQKQLSKKDLEIKYLVELIQNIGSANVNQQQQGLISLKSVKIEVLGQSLMHPQKAQLHKTNMLYQQFTNKYTFLLKKVTFLEERMESQEELITKLNQMNRPKNDSLVMDKSNQGDNLKILEEEKRELMKKIKNLEDENNDWKMEKVQQKGEMDKLLQTLESNKRQQVDRLNKELVSKKQQLDRLNREVSNLKKENENINKRFIDNNSRVKHLETEIEYLQKQKDLANSSAKEEVSKSRIKTQINEYMKQMEKNLQKIGGLSPSDIRNLLESEMKELADYIPKTIASKK